MKNSQSLNIQVIIGSTRQSRFSEIPAKWIYRETQKRKNLDAELVDLRDYDMPFYNEPMTPKMMNGKYPNPAIQKWANKIAAADGFIIVSPEYNHSMPAVLKNALDNIYVEWNNKPVGFVSYGGVSGARAIEQLRLVAIELQMAPINQSINIPVAILMSILRPVAGQKPPENPFESLTDHANSFLDQLIWWTKILKSGKK